MQRADVQAMQVLVSRLSGDPIEIEVEAHHTVGQLKKRLANMWSVSAILLELIWESKILSDSTILSAHGQKTLPLLAVVSSYDEKAQELLRREAQEAEIAESAARAQVEKVRNMISLRQQYAASRLGEQKTTACSVPSKHDTNNDITIFACMLSGQPQQVKIAPCATVDALKNRIATQIGVPVFWLSLLLGTVELENKAALGDLGIVNKTQVTIVNNKFAFNTFSSSQLTLSEVASPRGCDDMFHGKVSEWHVTIKRFSSECTDMFANELAFLKRIRHPRCVHLIGACDEPHDLCIVTEPMLGGSLHGVLSGQHDVHSCGVRCDTSSKRLQICEQVSEGVAALHALSPVMVHGCLSTHAVWLDAGGNAKICDFSMARSVDGVTHEVLLSKDTIVGKPRAMAPECFDSRGKYTVKVDVWSVGGIIVETFGGAQPYNECTNIQQLIAKVLIDKQPPSLPWSMPHNLKLIVEDCFQFDIDLRATSHSVFTRLRQLCLD